jgi:type IX secretion system PorP/SprF family membrane protein
MKTKVFLILYIIFLKSFVFSQDMHFSQFYMSPLTLNPGMAGVNYNFEAMVNYKDQWRGVTAPYKTFAASLDTRSNKREYKDGFWAGGINFFCDKAGDSKMGIAQANLTLAYHLRLAKYHTLGLGIQGGYAQRSIDYNALQWGSQYDPNNGYDPNISSGEAPLTPFSYGDLGGGIVWAFDNTSGLIHVEDNHDLKANLGVAVFHYKQKYSFYEKSIEKLYPKFVFHGNALISFPNTKIALVPGFVYYRQGPAQEIFAGTMVRYKLRQDSKYTGIKKGAALSLGGYFRAKDAITAAFLLEYSFYSIGFSYDLNASKLTPASKGRGGVEISLRYAPSNPYQKTWIENFKSMR